MLICSAQEKTRFVTDSSGFFSQRYHVLKSDQDVMHGKYIKSFYGRILFVGEYEYGERKGVWTFYDGDRWGGSYTYDYDTSDVVEYTPGDTVCNLPEQPDRPPLLAGSFTELRFRIADNIKYPDIAKYEGTSGTVTVSFTIDELGYPVDFDISRGVSPELDAEALRLVTESVTGMLWIPAVKDEKKIRCRMSLPVRFVAY